MSATTPAPAPVATPVHSKRARWRTSLLAHGEPSVWLCGGALTLALLMIGGLLTLIACQGTSTFWPVPVVQIKTAAGKVLLGEVTRTETYKPEQSVLDALSAAEKEKALKEAAANGGWNQRRLLRTGNFDITGTHHTWVSDFEIVQEEEPAWAVVVERFSWGAFYGTPRAFLVDGKPRADTAEAAWRLFEEYHPAVLERLTRRESMKKNELGALGEEENTALLALRDAEMRHGKGTREAAAAAQRLEEIRIRARAEGARVNSDIAALDRENDRFQLVFVTADGAEIKMPLAHVVRAYPANQLDRGDKWGVYFSRWGEFLTENPREANTEGGVFPAIFGTILMTLLMSIAVVPFGVMAALYLREYAKSGPIISIVRIAINNLAGVPSIVFGVFGLGFFCYLVGAFIDGGPERIQVAPLPPFTWWLSLTAAVLIGFFAFLSYLSSGRKERRGTTLGRLLSRGAALLWFVCFCIVVWLIVKIPYFDGFYRAKLPNPTFGTGGLLWASLTLALLTVPVVIVATEEALAAVPNSMREGSYACGASKWQTIRRIVMPRAMPGIMTGMILAMARGAGEVAPLMLVGAVKLAPSLPGVWPPEHLARSFLHLGFHIYDVGFQSPNSEAARPMVYTTTLLLIAIVALLNITAVLLRRRLRKRFQVNQF